MSKYVTLTTVDGDITAIFIDHIQRLVQVRIGQTTECLMFMSTQHERDASAIRIASSMMEVLAVIDKAQRGGNQPVL